MPKRDNSNIGLLERIDERTEYIQKEQDNVRRDVRDLKKVVFEKLEHLDKSVAILEDKDKNRVHVPKGNGGGKIIATILRFFR